MRMKKLRPHYSGNLSRKFWDLIHTLPEPDKTSLYSCGCLLQNIEHSILNWLQFAQSLNKTTKKYKKKK